MKKKLIIILILFIILLITVNRIERNKSLEPTFYEQETNEYPNEEDEPNSALEDDAQNVLTLSYENYGLTSMNQVSMGPAYGKAAYQHNNISVIEHLDGAESLEVLYLYDNDIETISNIETMPSDDFKELWVDESVNSITQESYNYLTSHAVNVYFVPEGEEVGSSYTGSSKTIEDLEIV